MNRENQPIRFRTLRHLISAPFIWVVLLPVLILDVFMEMYHRICFPLYGIPCVKRSEYIQIFDRSKLPYLTWIEKMGCAYCGYVNGWLHYASVIAAKTESYWCAIAHLEQRGYVPPEHEKDFAKYGDEATFHKRYALHHKLYDRCRD